MGEEGRVLGGRHGAAWGKGGRTAGQGRSQAERERLHSGTSSPSPTGREAKGSQSGEVRTHGWSSSGSRCVDTETRSQVTCRRSDHGTG